MTKRSAMPTYAQTMWNTPLIQRTIPFRSTTSGSARIMKEEAPAGTAPSNCRRNAVTQESAQIASVAVPIDSEGRRDRIRPTRPARESIVTRASAASSGGVGIGLGRASSGCEDPAGLKMMVVALIPLSLLSAARGAVARRSEQLLLHDRDKLVSRL